MIGGKAMRINVKLFAAFREGRSAATALDCPPGTRIAELIRELRIPEKDVGMIMVNNRHAEPDQQLEEGANVALFPLLGGG